MSAKKVKMSAEEYHAHQAVGSSSLRTLIQQSPAHYLWNRENPGESTPAQRLGTIIHAAILEPGLYRESVVVEPEFAGKGSREAKENWHLENHGKMILKRDQVDMISGILKAISANKKASQLIAAGRAEESLFWTDPETGIELKARPDFFRDAHQVIDVKSTADAGYQSFKKDIGNYMYHVQAAVYLDGASHIFDRKFDEFIILAVEKEPPYAVNCFLLEESAINEGCALYYKALKTLAECMKTGVYPAYPEELQHVDLPTWAYGRE